MNFTKTLTVGTFLASTLIAGTAFAKGHDNGFGAGAMGSAHGLVDDGVTNRNGGGSESTYGNRVDDPNTPENEAGVRAQVADGTRDKSDVAQLRDGSHPSQTKGN